KRRRWITWRALQDLWPSQEYSTVCLRAFANKRVSRCVRTAGCRGYCCHDNRSWWPTTGFAANPGQNCERTKREPAAIASTADCVCTFVLQASTFATARSSNV